APHSLDEQRRTLRLPQLDRARLPGLGLRCAAGCAQPRAERAPGVSVIEQRVGRRCDTDGGARELDCCRMLTTSRERLGPHAAPGDGGAQVVTRERLAL